MSRICLFLLVICFSHISQGQHMYHVTSTNRKVVVDGDWNKPVWQGVKSFTIENRMGVETKFRPVTEAKMTYDSDNVYVIFRVQDQYVKSTVTKNNGNVSGDSCVEFFFAPNSAQPAHYFNLEVNAGGTPLIFFVTRPWTKFEKLSDDLISEIEIAHSMPSVIDPEIQTPTTWTIEYRIPLSILRKFTDITPPAPGVQWKANFYKTGSNTSNPHYYTWAPVSNPEPNFHLPAYFGTIAFD